MPVMFFSQPLVAIPTPKCLVLSLNTDNTHTNYIDSGSLKSVTSSAAYVHSSRIRQNFSLVLKSRG